MIFSSIFRTISQKIYTNPIPLLLIILKLYSHLQCDFIYIVFQRQWHPTPVLLPGKSHGWRSLVGCSPWGCEESDMTERLHFHFSLPCIGKGNGNPLQCSCLENPRDGEPGGLPSIGSHRVGHDWSDLAATANWRQKYWSYSNNWVFPGFKGIGHRKLISDWYEVVRTKGQRFW